MELSMAAIFLNNRNSPVILTSQFVNFLTDIIYFIDFEGNFFKMNFFLSAT